MCLKTKNCCLKIFVEIRVSEKMCEKYVKYCLKTEKCFLKTLTKHPHSVCFCSTHLCLDLK